MEIYKMCGRLEALTRDWERNMALAVRLAAREALEVAREEVPVDTGKLKSSLRMEGNSLEGSVQAGEDYAAFVELGTADVGAQPFLRPAFLAGAERFRREAAVAILKERGGEAT